MATPRDLTSESLISGLDTSRRDFLKRLAAGASSVGTLNLILGSEGNGAPRQSTQTYTNPVYAGSMPDPFVLLHQDS